MTTDFSQLKKNRQTQFEAINSTLEKFNAPAGGAEDPSAEEFWKPTVDDAGNGSAIIRFLAAPPGEDVPFVRYWDHAFKGPSGQWYIEKSLSTFNEKDPVGELNAETWAIGTEEAKNIVRARKRRLHYVANILVVKDPGNPENEGKVFKFKFGKKIFDKIQDQIHPDPELDETPVNPFDLWEGANFRLKIRQVEGYRNYDKSEFDRPAPVAKDDKVIEGIWKSEYPLQPIVARDQFKSYDELKKRLETVLGTGTSNSRAPATSTSAPWDAPATTAAPVTKTKESPKIPAAEDDDDVQFFQRLANDD